MLAGCLGQLLSQDIQLAILGTGEAHYEHMLGGAASMAPDKMAVRFTFDEALSQRMYAGADMLLMPSLFEPCGLNQMIAMAYGTLPVVRETGGLRDSVIPYNKFTGIGNGFGFRNPNPQELEQCILSAAALYREDKPAWTALQKQAMAQDFGWKASAKQYMAIYRKITK